jgi:hypothetical protein
MPKDEELFILALLVTVWLVTCAALLEIFYGA